MVYQLKANLYFLDEDAINDIKDKILDHFDEASVVNPHSEAQELSELQILENHHDEDPNEPCYELFHIDNEPPPLDE